MATIISILVAIAISMLPQQISKGRDGRRKGDLRKIKIAFENYYNDNDCYPDPNILNNCGGADLAPYLQIIPCDPQTKTKYLYAPEQTSCPHYYRIFSNLEVDIDPVIKDLGCHTSSGCGAFSYFETELGLDALKYDYGVSEGVPVYITSDGMKPGSHGSCCAFIGDTCNVWDIKTSLFPCANLYIGEDECNQACSN